MGFPYWLLRLLPMWKCVCPKYRLEIKKQEEQGFILEKTGKNFRQYFDAKNPKLHKIIFDKGDPTQEWEVGAGSDDGRRRYSGGAWVFQTDVVWLQAGYYNTTNIKFGAGIRFTNVTIPKGATINSAYLKIHCRFSTSGTEVNTRISGDKSNSCNPNTFSTEADIADRYANYRTSAIVDWDNIPPWTIDNVYPSPDIKTVIQEIVNDPNWASGNALALFWEDFDDRSTHSGSGQNMREGAQYEDETYDPAKLEITWEEGTLVEVADSLELAETVLRNKTVILSDSLGLADSLYGNKSLLLGDSASLSELVTVIIGEVMKYVTDAVSSADLVSTPSRVLRTLEAIGVADNAVVNKILQITEAVGLAEIVEVGVGGVKKTRLFLILGDLAVQLTGD
jgi:hypothetical protein